MIRKLRKEKRRKKNISLVTSSTEKYDETKIETSKTTPNGNVYEGRLKSAREKEKLKKKMSP